MNVRVSLAALEADLEAVVWPGLSAVYVPCVESAEQVASAGRIVARLERMRGMRPGTVAIRPLVESARGMMVAGDIAGASERVRAFGTGPKLGLHLDAELGEALEYARDECELVARAFDLESISTEYMGD